MTQLLVCRSLPFGAIDLRAFHCEEKNMEDHAGGLDTSSVEELLVPVACEHSVGKAELAEERCTIQKKPDASEDMNYA